MFQQGNHPRSLPSFLFLAVFLCSACLCWSSAHHTTNNDVTQDLLWIESDNADSFSATEQKTDHYSIMDESTYWQKMPVQKEQHFIMLSEVSPHYSSSIFYPRV